MINNCITTIILDVQHFKLSKEVWDYLAGKYQPKGIAHQFGQYQEWNSLKYDGKDLEGFCSKYHAGLLSLKECDLKVDERIQIYQFIIHISPFFESFASNLRQSMRDMAAKEDLPSLDTIINNLLDESLAQKEAAAANFARNGRNHGQNNLDQDQGQGRSGKWCSECKFSGHTNNDCYHLHPELAPEGWKPRRSKALQNNQQGRNDQQGGGSAQSRGSEPQGNLSFHAQSIVKDLLQTQTNCWEMGHGSGETLIRVFSHSKSSCSRT